MNMDMWKVKLLHMLCFKWCVGGFLYSCQCGPSLFSPSFFLAWDLCLQETQLAENETESC